MLFLKILLRSTIVFDKLFNVRQLIHRGTLFKQTAFNYEQCIIFGKQINLNCSKLL